MLSITEYNQIKEKIISIVQETSISYPSKEIVGVMRKLGLGKMESIKMIHQLFNIDISEAKDLIHKDTVWSDKYIIDEDLHKRIEDLCNNIT